MTDKKTRLEQPLPRIRAGTGNLDTLAHVRAEMARLYRLAIGAKLRTDELAKLIYALREIRCCIEAENMQTVLNRLDRLDALVGERGFHGTPNTTHPPTWRN